MSSLDLAKTDQSQKAHPSKNPPKLKDLKALNLVYLEGSKALSQIDSYMPKLSAQFKKKIPKHYKEWYSKAREGLLDDEKDLWTTSESVQIVRNFLAGTYSTKEDLAIEKLIYELAKQQRKVLGAQQEIKVSNLKLKIKKLKTEIKHSKETIDKFVDTFKTAKKGSISTVKKITVSQNRIKANLDPDTLL